jgi:cobyrinic acid a,c-diamide synthase
MSAMGLMEGTENELAAVYSTALLLLLLQVLVVVVETNEGIDKQVAD